jgi:hypothetical protein
MTGFLEVQFLELARPACHNTGLAGVIAISRSELSVFFQRPHFDRRLLNRFTGREPPSNVGDPASPARLA